MTRFTFLDCQMDDLTMQETLNHIKKTIKCNLQIKHCVVNVAKLISMRNNNQLKNSVVNSDVINIDGIGLVLGARLLGYRVKERVTGIDLFEHLISYANDEKIPIYLLGAKKYTLEKVKKNLIIKHPNLNIVGSHHGYFNQDEDQSIVKEISLSGAKMLFVGMSSPKKEIFIDTWTDSLGVNLTMGVGGTFDIIAKETRRAPKYIQRIGLEWLFRLIQEPGRMWKRYLYTNSYYLLILFREYIISKLFK